MKIILGEDLGLILDKVDDLFPGKNYKKIILDQNYEDVIREITQSNLFSNSETPKPYVIEDFNLILSTSSKKDSKEVIDFLDELKKNKDNKNIVFILNSKEISKTYLSYFEVIQIKKLNKLTIKKYCFDLLKKYKVNLQHQEFNYLVDILPPDSLLIKNEIKKLSFVDEKITASIINKLIPIDINKNTFELIDNFFNRNYEKIIKQIHLLEMLKIDFNEIFNIMVAQLFSLKLYRLNYLENRSYDKICKDFSVQMFQIEKWKKLILSVDISQIDILLSNLLELNILYLSGRKSINTYLKIVLLNGGEYGL